MRDAAVIRQQRQRQNRAAQQQRNDPQQIVEPGIGVVVDHSVKRAVAEHDGIDDAGRLLLERIRIDCRGVRAPPADLKDLPLIMIQHDIIVFFVSPQRASISVSRVEMLFCRTKDWNSCAALFVRFKTALSLI